MKSMRLCLQLFILLLIPELHLFQYFFTPIRVEEYQIPNSEEVHHLDEKAKTTQQTEESLMNSALLLHTNDNKRVHLLSQDYRARTFSHNPATSSQDLKQKNVIQGFTVKENNQNNVMFLNTDTLHINGIDVDGAASITISGKVVEAVPGLYSKLADKSPIPALLNVQASLSRSNGPAAPPAPLAAGETPRKARTFFSHLGGPGRFSEIKKDSSKTSSLPSIHHKSSPGAIVQVPKPSLQSSNQHGPGNLFNRQQDKRQSGAVKESETTSQSAYQQIRQAPVDKVTDDKYPSPSLINTFESLGPGSLLNHLQQIDKQNAVAKAPEPARRPSSNLQRPTIGHRPRNLVNIQEENMQYGEESESTRQSAYQQLRPVPVEATNDQYPVPSLATRSERHGSGSLLKHPQHIDKPYAEVKAPEPVRRLAASTPQLSGIDWGKYDGQEPLSTELSEELGRVLGILG